MQIQQPTLKSILSAVLLTVVFWGCLDGSDQDIDPIINDNLVQTKIVLPQRSADALDGSEIVEALANLSLRQREERILSEILSGNLPEFMRQLVPVTIEESITDTVMTMTYYVTADYMMIGSDSDYFLVPMTPILAQELADSLAMTLITRKMVTEVWKKSDLKLAPSPIPPSAEMVTVPVFSDHNSAVWSQRSGKLEQYPLGSLTAGHKKDVILSNRINTNQSKVVIFGWHQLNGQAIQPLYSGHVNWYADYSHGIRFVQSDCIVNGEKRNISEILQDPELYRLISDEDAPMEMPRYPADKSDYPY